MCDTRVKDGKRLKQEVFGKYVVLLYMSNGCVMVCTQKSRNVDKMGVITDAPQVITGDG